MSRDPAFNTITETPSTSVDMASVTVPQDALAAPANGDLISAAMTLWPQGAAWGSPDGEAVPLSDPLARFTRVLLDPFVRLYGRAWALAREATAGGASELLPEWEHEYGLPEACFTGAQTTSQRLTALARKVRADAVIHPQDFVRLALDYGFEIEIEEPAVFSCGFSECGGFHTTGAATEEVFWIVRVKYSAVSYFECSVSECGHDPLFSPGMAAEIFCMIRKMAPAWTVPVLEPWITLAAIVDENGNVFVDEYGNTLVVPIANEDVAEDLNLLTLGTNFLSLAGDQLILGTA